MNCKVCKFGGTSMADGNVILRAAEIVQAESERRYVVVSAPGKRFSGDIKVTDLLYALYDAYEAKDMAQFEALYAKISVRFLNIEREIGKELNVQAALDEAKEQIFKARNIT